MCPSTSGFKGWRAMSYDPNTGALYIPVTMNCELATFGPVERVLGGGGAGPVKRINTLHPYSGGNLGELLVIDVREGDIMWRHRTLSPINTAALATGGGVVFAGDYDRYVYAYEARTGQILWQTRLPTSAQGFPVTYLAGGRQYVAIPVGTGGASWAGMVPRDLIPPHPASEQRQLDPRLRAAGRPAGGRRGRRPDRRGRPRGRRQSRRPRRYGTASTPPSRRNGAPRRTGKPAPPATATISAAAATRRAWSASASSSCGATRRSTSCTRRCGRPCRPTTRPACRARPISTS